MRLQAFCTPAEGFYNYPYPCVLIFLPHNDGKTFPASLLNEPQVGGGVDKQQLPAIKGGEQRTGLVFCWAVSSSSSIDISFWGFKGVGLAQVLQGVLFGGLFCFCGFFSPSLHHSPSQRLKQFFGLRESAGFLVLSRAAHATLDGS